MLLRNIEVYHKQQKICKWRWGDQVIRLIGHSFCLRKMSKGAISKVLYLPYGGNVV